jgi:Aldose 1-epimerase
VNAFKVSPATGVSASPTPPTASEATSGTRFESPALQLTPAHAAAMEQTRKRLSKRWRMSAFSKMRAKRRTGQQAGFPLIFAVPFAPVSDFRTAGYESQRPADSNNHLLRDLAVRHASDQKVVGTRKNSAASRRPGLREKTNALAELGTKIVVTSRLEPFWVIDEGADMRRLALSKIFGGAVIGLVVACGGSQPAASTAESPAAPPAEPAAGDATSGAAAALPAKVKVEPIAKAAYGKVDGQDVELYTLTNKNGLVMKVTNYGVIITEFWAPDRKGKLEDIVGGYESVDGYVKATPYFGATVGRVANRIKNAEFKLEGKSYKLAANNGTHHLHGGKKGWDKVIWSAAPARPVRNRPEPPRTDDCA